MIEQQYLVCPICISKFEVTDNIVIVKHKTDESLNTSRRRKHYYHRDCIVKCGGKCPLDRECIHRLYSTPYYAAVGLDLGTYQNYYELVDNNNLTKLSTVTNINRTDMFGKTLLYCACQRGNLPLVKKLIKNGADIHISDLNKFTPLMAAVCHNHYGVVRELMKITNNELFNKQDIHGYSAFRYACRFGRVKIIDDFLRSGYVSVPEANAIVHYQEFSLPDPPKRYVIDKIMQYVDGRL